MDKRVIVEGVDGAGKTTLIEGLRREFHFLTPPIVNTLRSKQDFTKWWPEQLGIQYPQGIVPVHDRFYYSELVYGKVLRGKILGDKVLHTVTRRQLREHAFLIYARPPGETIAEGLRVNKQMRGVRENWTDLLEAYDKLMQIQPIYYGDRFFVYDWRYSRDFKELVERLEAYFECEGYQD